jgi:hypothetical protein
MGFSGDRPGTSPPTYYESLHSLALKSLPPLSSEGASGKERGHLSRRVVDSRLDPHKLMVPFGTRHTPSPDIMTLELQLGLDKESEVYLKTLIGLRLQHLEGIAKTLP